MVSSLPAAEMSRATRSVSSPACIDGYRLSVSYGGVPTERPALERRIVGRALEDPEFRARLLENPRQAVAEELGFALPEALQVEVVVESAEKLTIVLPVDLTGIGLDGVWAMTGKRPQATAKAPPKANRV
jgi:hypothetical protein